MASEAVVPSGTYADYFSSPSVHARLAADQARIRLFCNALARVVVPTSKVIDLGAGTGVLTSAALNLGAANVVAIEENGDLFPVHQPLFAEAISSGRLVVVRQNSREWDGEGLGDRVDVIVSETIGTFGINEGILPSLEDAVRRFLTPVGVCIPEHVGIEVQLVPTPALGRNLGSRVEFDVVDDLFVDIPIRLEFPTGRSPHRWSSLAYHDVPQGDWSLMIRPIAKLFKDISFVARDMPPSFGTAIIPLPGQIVPTTVKIALYSEYKRATFSIQFLDTDEAPLQFDWIF